MMKGDVLGVGATGVTTRSMQECKVGERSVEVQSSQHGGKHAWWGRSERGGDWVVIGCAREEGGRLCAHRLLASSSWHL